MKKKYKSNYTDDLITEAQFITEYMCERIAKKEKKVLTHKFWKDPEYKKIFQRQIVAANLLLKEVTCIQIMSFLKSKKGSWILSLGVKKPILDGCKSRASTEYNKPEPVDDGFMSDFTDEDSEVEIKTDSKNLWKKLNQ